MPSRTPRPQFTPTAFPFSELPGWFTYMDFNCEGFDICTSISVGRPDVTRIQRVSEHDRGLAFEPRWSPDGRYIAYQLFPIDQQPGVEILVFDFATRKNTVLTRQRVPSVGGLSWSPDSSQIVFANSDPETGASFLQILRLGTREVRDLTHNSEFADLDPAWSPDGATIAFSSDRDYEGTRARRIWTVSPDGQSLFPLTPQSNMESAAPSWSPDSRTLAFIQTHVPQDAPTSDPSTSLCFVRPPTQQPDCPLELPASGTTEPPAWSPDGRRIVFSTGDEERNDLWLFDVNDGWHFQVNLGPGRFYSFSWSPDSRAVSYMEEKGEMSRASHLLIVVEGGPFDYWGDSAADDIRWSPVADLPYPPPGR